MNPPPSAPRTRPTSAPQTNETREIIRLTQNRKKIYPKLTLDNFDEYKYRELVDPLRKNPGELSKIQKEFLDNMDLVKDKLKNTALSNFSYNEAKTSATGRGDQARFSQLDRSIKMVASTQSTPIGDPDLEKLFGAQTVTDFYSRLGDTNIVHAVYGANRDFREKARRVFDYIKSYRDRNRRTLRESTIDNYLNDIFHHADGKDHIETSTIIKPNLLTADQKASIEKAYDQYHLYRGWLKKQFQLEKTIKKERETFLSKPVEYAKSGERYVAEKIQTMRDHWAGMDGKEKFIAGLTILVGTAWFLNSENEGVQKARDAMMKAGLIAVGYIGLNTTSKVLFGKSLSEKAGNYIEDRSGKRDFLKESFNTDKYGADNINTSLAVLGNYDFLELSNMYLTEEAKYKKFHTPNKLRGISVGGVAENEMPPHTIYSVMKIVDKRLRKDNSSIEKLNIELAKAKADAQRQGRAFVSPTWAMIVTAILQNQKLGWTIDKKGKIKMTPEKDIDTAWSGPDKNRTKNWWPITGRPKDWRLATVDNKPKEGANGSQLSKLSSCLIPPSKPLSGIITTKHFGRYTIGFNKLYVHQYSKTPTQAVHKFEDTSEKATYISSKIKVDTGTHRNANEARIASVQGAYQQAIKNLKDEIDKNPRHRLKSVKDRLSEFVQPVFGTFVGKSKNTAREYVMFLRLVMPDSFEHKLRKAHEWPDGNMMEQAQDKPLTSGDKLTRGDFQTLAKKETTKVLGVSYPELGIFKKDFGGAYESFLARVRLNKTETHKIDKILDSYSKRFAGSGMSKRGLVRYLAAHDFTDAELKEALGLDASATLPRIDIYSAMKLAVSSTPIKDSSPGNRAYIMHSLGMLSVLACHGDDKALAAVAHIDMNLKTQIVAYQVSPVPNPLLLSAQFTATIMDIYNKDDAAAKQKRRQVQIETDKYCSI